MSAQQENASSANEQEHVHVLVVEDDRPIRTLLGFALEAGGYTHTLTQDPKDAAPHIGNSILVLSDVEMPEGGVEEVAKQMRAAQEAGNDPGTLVVMTASRDRAARIRYGEEQLEYPVAYVIDKPFDMAHLLGVIETHLQQDK